VAQAGLLAPAVLVQQLGFTELVTDTLHLPESVRANSAAKLATVLAGMLAGADSIDDLDVLRSGATPRLFDDLRAPPTVGSWLRGFTCGHVRQLDALSRVLQWPGQLLGSGPDRPQPPPTDRRPGLHHLVRPTGRPSPARRSATPARPARCCTPGCESRAAAPAQAVAVDALLRVDRVS
jgi:hypothetical protein